MHAVIKGNRFSILPCLFLLLFAVSLSAFAWTDVPTPFSDQHVVMMRPGDFSDSSGSPAAEEAKEQFFGQVVKIAEPVTCPMKVKYAGKYNLWVRIADSPQRQPVRIELLSGKSTLLAGTVNDGDGSIERGGEIGFKAFVDQAKERKGAAADGAPDDPDANLDGANVDQNLIDELNGKPYLRWISASRIETPVANAVYYWWNVGSVKLDPGKYLLRASGGPGKLNAGFLTTYPDLVYPCGGDIDIQPGSYIRFRIDAIPGRSLALSGKLRIHSMPWYSETGQFTPEGLLTKESKPFLKPGYSPWYRLQDLKDSPAYGPVLCHLLLDIPAGAEGATQFAWYPHPDYITREISWQEFGGDQISMETDFEHGIDKIRTLRDHAREFYERATREANGRLYPLTRGPLYLASYSGGATQDFDRDYILKTFRLLGFNCSGSPDPVAALRRYGWTNMDGWNAPLDYMPFDENFSQKKYDEFFKDTFKGKEEVARITSIYQIADEPGEFYRTQMSSPLWRYYPPEKGGPRLDDRGGGSELYTKKIDYKNCVLDGKVIRYGGTVVLRVGCDSTNPKKYGEWEVGDMQYQVTLKARRNGETGGVVLKIYDLLPANVPVPFKIIYAGDTAALYIKGKLINRIGDLSVKGGFGIAGYDPKGFTELRIRPMTPEERRESVPVDNADPDNIGGLPPDDEGVEVEGAELPEWAKPKPLDQYVKEDWVISGGLPEAHIAFRKWLQGQGMTPQFFGKKSWDDVSIITEPKLVDDENDRKIYYWSRRYSGYLTPKLFSQACEAVRKASPNKSLLVFYGLSGHYYFGDLFPMDVFQCGQYGGATLPGVSDWMSNGGWRWDSNQTVAYSVAPFNAGGRVYGGMPKTFPMMHCVFPTDFRAYTMLANNVRVLSFYAFGPSYAGNDYWSEVPECYSAVQVTNNRCAQVDDILSYSTMRHSRVALLFSMSNEYWAAGTPSTYRAGNAPPPKPEEFDNLKIAFSDKRITFLALSHEYFQPELVTEDQVTDSALQHYDALYILDPVVSLKAQAAIEEYLKKGGIVWVCADALRWDEYMNPLDFLQRVAGLKRSYTTAQRNITMIPEPGETAIRTQTTVFTNIDTVNWPGAKVRARYGDGRPAWLEKAVGKGKIIYLAHRCGWSYTKNSIGGYINQHELDAVFADTGREPLVLPLKEANVERELTFSSPLIMANPLSNETGTVIPMFNMTAAPARNLQFSLKEPVKPASVQAFVGMKKIDIPFTYANGRVEGKVPEFLTSQMILVRKQPAPADDRLEKMHVNTVSMLASTDINDILAGIFYAGYFPEWKLAAKVAPYLRHADREVRRNAADALGRLKYSAAADTLVKAIATEVDTHALAEEVYALGILDDARFPELALKTADPKRPILQQLVLEATVIYLKAKKEAGKLDGKMAAFGQIMLNAADDSDDPRIYSQVAPLMAIISPMRPLTILKETLPKATIRDLDGLAKAVAEDDAAFTAFFNDPPANPQAVLAVARQRQDPRMARLIMARMHELANSDVNPYMNTFMLAALKQADPALAKQLFAEQQKLPEYLQGKNTCLILDATFNARLGSLVDEWGEWLKAH